MHSAPGTIRQRTPTCLQPSRLPATAGPARYRKACLLPHLALPRPWPASARVGPLADTRSSAGKSAGISAGPRGGPMLRARCSERTRTVAPPAWQGSRAAAFSGRETGRGRQQLDRRLTRRTRSSISLTNEPRDHDRGRRMRWCLRRWCSVSWRSRAGCRSVRPRDVSAWSTWKASRWLSRACVSRQAPGVGVLGPELRPLHGTARGPRPLAARVPGHAHARAYQPRHV
jgi:hypothetical protein